MNQEQKFDKIIKKKVDEAEFPFDEQNWNKLSMQLDAERSLSNKRGWGKFLFLGLLFLGITSASIALYEIQGPLSLKDVVGKKSSSDNNSNSGTSAQGVNVNNSSNQNSDNHLLASNNINTETNKTVNYNLNESSGLEKTTENNKTSQSVDASSAFNQNSNESTIDDSNNNSKGLNVVESKNYATSNLNNTESKYSSLAKSSNGFNKNNKAELAEINTKDADVNEMNSAFRTKSELAGGIILDHNVLDRIDSRLPIVYSNRNLKLAALKLPTWYDDDYHRKGKKRISFLNVEIGGAYLLGWNSKDGKDGRGFNGYAGVNYGKFLNKKIGFSVGSQFYNIGNIKQSYYECSKSVYGLGSTSSNTIITTQSLYYFSVPVKLYYAVNSSNQIGISVNSSFLFSSNNIVENYRLTDNIKSNEITTKSSGIYEGVRLNNVLVSAFYKTKLNKRLFLNTEFIYGLRDIFKNSNSNNYDQKPLGLRLGVQYTLFEK